MFLNLFALLFGMLCLVTGVAAALYTMDVDPATAFMSTWIACVGVYCIVIAVQAIHQDYHFNKINKRK